MPVLTVYSRHRSQSDSNMASDGGGDGWKFLAHTCMDKNHENMVFSHNRDYTVEC